MVDSIPSTEDIHIENECASTHFEPETRRIFAKKELSESAQNMLKILAAYTFLSEYKQVKLKTDLIFYNKRGLARLDTVSSGYSEHNIADCQVYLWDLRFTLIEGKWYIKLIAAQAAVPTAFVLSETAPRKFIRDHVIVKLSQQYFRAINLFFEKTPRTLLINVMRQEIFPYVHQLDEKVDLKTFQDRLNNMTRKLFDHARRVSCSKSVVLKKRKNSLIPRGGLPKFRDLNRFFFLFCFNNSNQY